MNIGIIGAGNIGAALAKKLVTLGHHVKIVNSRGPDTLSAIASETGAKAVALDDAVKDVEVVIVTIPQKAIPQLPAGLFRDVPPNVVVADTGNYYPMRDGNIAELDAASLTESEWVAKHLGRPVLKVFNNIMSQSLVEGSRTSERIALAIAGDDAKAKALLSRLVDALGFGPIDGGSLAESWRQQPGTPAYCTDLPVEAAKRALAAADRALSPARRDESLRQLIDQNPGLTHAEMVRKAREIQRTPL